MCLLAVQSTGNIQIMGKLIRKRILIFPDGSRTLSIGNAFLSPDGIEPGEQIDISKATDNEIEQLKVNLNNTKLINKIDSRQQKT